MRNLQLIKKHTLKCNVMCTVSIPWINIFTKSKFPADFRYLRYLKVAKTIIFICIQLSLQISIKQQILNFNKNWELGLHASQFAPKMESLVMFLDHNPAKISHCCIPLKAMEFKSVLINLSHWFQCNLLVTANFSWIGALADKTICEREE